MKKNDWVLLLSVALYSYLFYEQAAGINFLIFTIALLGGSIFKNPNCFKNANWIFAATGALVSAICIMVYSSPLAIITNIFSLGILSVMNFSPSTSVLVSLGLTLCSAGSSIAFMFIDMFRRRKNNQLKENTRPFYVKVIVFLIVAVITILFFSLYQTSNPLFKDFTKNINLDFISAAWIFFTLGGLLLLYGFYYNRHLGVLTENESSISNYLIKDEVSSKGFLNNLFKQDTEMLTGIILFSVLNVMLLVLNVLDLNYLWFDGKLPDGMQHKEFVHEGVGTLILSVVLAIIILLYFFRGRLNFDEKNKSIKVLAYIWIIQNAFMIFSTAYRMNMYVSESGISYKKIGVYVYLSLTFIGLITTYIKVAKNKTNWFLFRINPKIYFALMVISCTVNWDVFITGFNINKALTENKKLEKYYLVDLSFKNIPQLLQLNDTIKSFDDYEARDYYYASRGTYFYSFKTALDKKLYDFLKAYSQNQDWQSYCNEKKRVYDELKSLNSSNQIKSLDLQNNYAITSLKPVEVLSNINELNLSHCSFKNLSELNTFPGLTKLNLQANQIDSLHSIPHLAKLELLDLSENAVTGLDFLKHAGMLKELNLQSNSLNTIASLPQLNYLHSLNLNSNPIDNFSELSNFPALSSLDIGNTFKGLPDSVAPLPKLERLTLSANTITSINSKQVVNFFASAVNLQSLDISANEIGNLYFLIHDDSNQAIFPMLESISLGNNKIHTLAGIGVNTNLKSVFAGNNNISELSPLLKLRNLKELSLEYNPIGNLQGIEQLKELEYLNVSTCNIRNGLTLLSQLENLKDLTVAGNHIVNPAPIFEIKKLTRLNLTDNKLKSLKGIEKLQNLEELYLTQNQISDFTPLGALKKLKTVYTDPMSNEQLIKLRKAIPDCKINENGNYDSASELH